MSLARDLKRSTNDCQFLHDRPSQQTQLRSRPSDARSLQEPQVCLHRFSISKGPIQITFTRASHVPRDIYKCRFGKQFLNTVSYLRTGKIENGSVSFPQTNDPLYWRYVQWNRSGRLSFFSASQNKPQLCVRQKCINKSKHLSQHMFSLLLGCFTRQTEAKLKSINRQHHMQAMFSDRDGT